MQWDCSTENWRPSCKLSNLTKIWIFGILLLRALKSPQKFRTPSSANFLGSWHNWGLKSKSYYKNEPSDDKNRTFNTVWVFCRASTACFFADGFSFIPFVSFFHFRFSITQWKQKCHKRLLLECHSIRDAMMAAQCSLQENYKLVFSTYYPQLSFLRCQNLLEEIFF